MSNILLLETATDVCSVAIGIDGAARYAVEDPSVNRHAEKLTVFIGEVLQQAGMALHDLDAVAVSRGPGSYTSLRVGASVAKGICYALGKPLVAVDTLAALAYGARQLHMPTQQHAPPAPPYYLMPMLDARRQEVWTAVYDGALTLLEPPQALIIENNLFEKFVDKIFAGRPEGLLILAGNGAVKTINAGSSEGTVFSPVQSCSATFLAMLAEEHFLKSEFQDIAYFEPHYMKTPNITAPRRVQL